MCSLGNAYISHINSYRVKRLSSTRQEHKTRKKNKDLPKSTVPENIYEIACDDNSGYQELREFNNISTYDKLK